MADPGMDSAKWMTKNRAREENAKLTISFKKSSVDFVKKEAKKHHTSYQKMIRQLVDWYTRTASGLHQI